MGRKGTGYKIFSSKRLGSIVSLGLDRIPRSNVYLFAYKAFIGEIGIPVRSSFLSTEMRSCSVDGYRNE